MCICDRICTRIKESAGPKVHRHVWGPQYIYQAIGPLNKSVNRSAGLSAGWDGKQGGWGGVGGWGGLDGDGRVVFGKSFGSSRERENVFSSGAVNVEYRRIHICQVFPLANIREQCILLRCRTCRIQANTSLSRVSVCECMRTNILHWCRKC